MTAVRRQGFALTPWRVGYMVKTEREGSVRAERPALGTGSVDRAIVSWKRFLPLRPVRSLGERPFSDQGARTALEVGEPLDRIGFGS